MRTRPWIAPPRPSSPAVPAGTRPWRRLAAVALAAVALAAALGGPTLAATRPTVHYLSPSGKDSNPGSISRPWHSLYASIAKLRPGDTLYVRGGAYSFGGIHYTELAGTAAHPIVIRAYPGETPVFTGTTTPADFLYFDGNSAYVTLRGLTVRGGGAVSSTKGSSLLGFEGNANHIRILGMRLYGSPGWSVGQHLVYVASSTVHDITISGNTFDGRGCACGGLLQFYHDPNATRFIVSSNRFVHADQAVLIWANVSGLQIKSNTFSSVRIAVRHHNSAGTTITGNTGSHVTIGVYADSRANLVLSGNHW
jgi:nitrous oxidase accessory protein NosD